MAFSQFVIGTKSGKPTQIYNIDWAVGRPASNARDDVMLVQALFRIFYYELMGFNEDCDPPAGSTGPIAVDGWYGPVTQRHIDHFQTQMVTKGESIARDGRLDPYRDAGGTLSTIQHLYYGLAILNSRCQNLCYLQGVDNYSNLPNREDVPAMLRNALKMVKKTARQYQGGGWGQQTVPSTGGA